MNINVIKELNNNLEIYHKNAFNHVKKCGFENCEAPKDVVATVLKDYCPYHRVFFDYYVLVNKNVVSDKNKQRIMFKKWFKTLSDNKKDIILNEMPNTWLI